jgi:protein-export membrane protein SecD
MRNNTIVLILIGLLVAVALFVVLPLPHPDWLVRSETTGGAENALGVKLGLDLQGGTQVLLEAALPPGQTLTPGVMNTARSIVENRVNGLGVSEAVVQLQGEDRIITELPGVRDPDQAIRTIQSTGQLEFVDPQGATLLQGMMINTTNHPGAVEQAQIAAASGLRDPVDAPYGSQVFQTAMTGDVLREALAMQDQVGRWQISFLLSESGNDIFYQYTSANIGRPMAIVLDGVVLSAPVIEAAIRDQGVINGTFTQDEAQSLAVQMQYGALPVPLNVADTRTIGATLGADSVRSSIIAGLIGLVAVMIFMMAMYRVPGLLANIALICYVLFNLAIYKLIPVTLTLPGIAGFLLSIGMAVDANILIFERTREELRLGRSPRLAAESGFSRAWPAIWDSNLTTLISCAVLYWFGSSFGASIVQGYAFTLGVGVMLSMFTAYVVTRAMMRALLGSRQQNASAQAIVGY